MNNNSARCFWLSDHRLGCLNRRCLDLANSCLSVSPLGNNWGSYGIPRFRDSIIFLLSASKTSQRYLIRSSCTASYASFWTWNRSITRLAFLKHLRIAFAMLGAISMVTSFTLFLERKGIRSRTVTISSAFVPLIVARIVPLRPFADLLLTMVYSSPLLKLVSSMLRCAEIFSGNNVQLSA